MVAKTGQFGNYVTDGVINATIPKDEPIEEIANDRAYELLAIRREKLGVEPGEAPKTAKKPARKKSPLLCPLHKPSHTVPLVGMRCIHSASERVLLRKK